MYVQLVYNSTYLWSSLSNAFFMQIQLLFVPISLYVPISTPEAEGVHSSILCFTEDMSPLTFTFITCKLPGVRVSTYSELTMPKTSRSPLTSRASQSWRTRSEVDRRVSQVSPLLILFLTSKPSTNSLPSIFVAATLLLIRFLPI